MKPDLMAHRKIEHYYSVAPCRNKDCEFSSDKCWWKHANVNENENKSIGCYFCEKTFGTRTEVMMHRKVEHSKTVKACTKYVNKTCNYSETTCWFQHNDNVSTHSNLNEASQSVFRGGPINPKPPLKNQ
jgi:hypothetical protein